MTESPRTSPIPPATPKVMHSRRGGLMSEDAMQQDCLFVTSGQRSLILGRVRGKEIVWHRDDARRRLIAHKSQSNRVSEHSKAVCRRGGGPRAMEQRREEIDRKHEAWMEAFTRKMAEQIISAAEAEHVMRISVDLQETPFARGFPWTTLKSKLQDACKRKGIELLDIAN